MRATCFECALRACGLFRPVIRTELAFINNMKRDHLTAPAGTAIIRAGQDSAELDTLDSGKTLTLTNPRVLEGIAQHFDQELARRPLI